MPLESTIFGAFRSKSTVICYANWCADSLGAWRHSALSGFDFGWQDNSGQGRYQSTNMPYNIEGIPESHESLAD